MKSKHISQLGFMQFAICQGDIWKNFERVQAMLVKGQPPAGSLIALPEMWATGFVYERLEHLSKEVPLLLQELDGLATSHGIILAGSLPWRETADSPVSLTNRLCFSGLGEEESPGIAKQHLFAFWKEDQWLTPGTEPEPVRLAEEATVGGLVCYDLRFPEAAKRQCRKGANILLMSAQWPMARISQWRTLLQARAIENQCFLIAANGCGSWESLQLGGHSMLIAPDGEVLAEADEGESCQFLSYNLEVQKELRERFNTVAENRWAKDDVNKVCSLQKLAAKIDDRRRIGQKIVFTNGCFDILHAGHVDYLQQARQQGDFLVLGLNNDASIRSIKGPERPINQESDRARVVAALGCVDAVVLFGEDTPLNLITTLQPDVLVKGADWAEESIVGAREVKEAGGKVVRIAFSNQTSTTATIEKIRG